METPNENKAPEPEGIGVRVDALVRRITATGFTVKDKTDNSIILTNGILRVGVFSEDFPRPEWKGKVLADHEVNFDKWSKCFYSCTFPGVDGEYDILIADLKHIKDDNNQQSSNCSGHLFRSF